MPANNIKIRKFKNFTWTDIVHPDKNALEGLSDRYDIDIQLLEDSIERGHLPKIEKVGKHTFIILRAYTAKKAAQVTTVGDLSNKIAFFVNEEELLTIHRPHFSFLDNITEAYDHPEILMIDIINAMAETYRQPIDSQSRKMDRFEKEIFLNDDTQISLEELYYQKSKARISKKLLALTHIVLNQWQVNLEHKSRLQDVKDSIIDFELLYDEVIEDANNLMNSYLSITAQKNNDVMKLLTIFSVFFLPLTFIAGIYGMNFHNMPELRWKYAYFIVWVIMIIISVLIYIWFKRKRIL
jgi:magnesium transporter